MSPAAEIYSTQQQLRPSTALHLPLIGVTRVAFTTVPTKEQIDEALSPKVLVKTVQRTIAMWHANLETLAALVELVQLLANILAP